VATLDGVSERDDHPSTSGPGGSDRHDDAADDGTADPNAGDTPDVRPVGFDNEFAFERLVGDPDVHEPVMIVQLDGWIDAAESARIAADVIDHQCETSPIVRFDDDTYVDFRARRPILQLRDGLSTDLVWPSLELRAGTSPNGTDIVTLRGPEPDMAWHRFARAITSLAKELGVTQMVGLGAYPFAAPHTRPSHLSVSSPSTDVLASVPYLRSSVDVPAGAEALLEHAMHAAKIPAIGLWAQVPHYAATADYPAAAVALLDGVARVGKVRVGTESLSEAAGIRTSELDDKITDSPELAALLSSLEDVWDRTAAEAEMPDADEELELRSGDELAAEIQQFLRDRD